MSPLVAGAISVVLGWLVLAAALRLRLPGHGTVVGDWALSAAIAVLLMAAGGVVLLRFGLFLPVGIALASALLAVGVLVILSGSGERAADSKPLHGRDGLVILASIVLAGLVFLPFPTYFLNGARDHGVYLIQALMAANTGEIDPSRPELAAVRDAFGDGVWLGLPGFYNVLGEQLGDDVTALVPQFRQLNPVLIAFGSWIGGLEGAVRASGALSVLAVALFFLVARRYLNVWWSAVTAVALLFNASVLWVGRSTFTEPTALLVQLGLVALLHRLIDRPSAGLAGLAGVVAGLASLNRWDGAVTCFVVAGFAGYVLLHQPRLMRSCRVLITVYTAVSLAGYLDGMIFSIGQYRDLATLVHLQIAVLCVVWSVVMLAGAPTNLLDRIRHWARPLTDWAIVAAGAFAAVWAAYKTSIGLLSPETFDDRVLVEMFWYLGPLLLLLLVYPLLRRLASADQTEFAFLMYFSAVAYVFLFTVDSHISPDHFWASRRWIPQVFPHVILVAVVALSVAFERVAIRRRMAAGIGAAALLGAYVVPNLVLSSSFIIVSQMKRFPGDVEAIAERVRQFQPSPVVLLEPGIGHVLGATLTYLHGIPAAILTQEGMVRARSGAYDGHVVIGRFRVRGPEGSDETVGVDRACGDRTVNTVARRPSGHLAHFCVFGRIGHLHQRRQVLAIGRRYDLAASGEALNTLGVGWGSIENWGVWLQDETGVLEFRLPETASGPCRLRLTGSLFLREQRPSFNVTVRGHTGRTLAQFTARDPEREFDWTIDIGADEVVGDSATLELLVDALVSPRQIGLSMDPRQLSIGLQSITLERCGEAD